MPNPLLSALALAAACVALAPASQAVAQGKTKVKTKTKTEQPATAAPATDWSVNYANTITQEDLRQHLSVLASDEYEGRETGEKGQKMAAAYLAQQFRQIGLAGPVKDSDNPFIQHFTLERSLWDLAKMKLQIGKQSYAWMTDFYASGDSPFSQETTLQPVFAGYGIEQGDYNDYATLDVKGKDVVVLLGEPLKDGKPLLSTTGKPSKWGTDSRAKAALATEKGARSVFFVNPDAAKFTQSLTRLKPYLQRPRMSMPAQALGMSKEQAPVARAATFFVSTPVGLELLNTSAEGVAKYQAAVATAGKPTKAAFRPEKVVIRAPRKMETFATENVMGYLEGSDKKDEVLVVSAHYDHLGIRDGKVFNGADDDGSGTVSVLEMAQAFVQAKQEGHGPRRSILFLTVTGEEEGLFGSEYYTDHPVFPLEQTIADLNLDMVGRTDDKHKVGDQYVCLVGSDKLSSELHAINEAMNKQYTQLDLDYRYNDPADPERVYYRSDHYNFAKHRVPVIFYTTGDHADYHQETDEVDKIEFPLMEKRDRLVFHTAWELVNRDQRIVVDSNKP
ncbi:M28 family peptidase [Hymenobacter busanensis]|uniref:M28 family peptidase n=1 Tax=Hymenobacter busanensis TaxID=2607656 RepID=A0A7L4ZZG3_9BACT|nr:M28 family peptidase [Hymenobacter busanensis]KAA9331493.1 M28 family peptidase [Hymenobacter busanensis]QHJ08648.1 M28 family peptidase [Hymenobacter busanensis]